VRDLAARIRTRPRLPAVPDQRLVDMGRLETRARYRGLGCDGSEFSWMSVTQRPTVSANRRPRGADDEDRRHSAITSHVIEDQA
jgi:hypothetical protein